MIEFWISILNDLKDIDPQLPIETKNYIVLKNQELLKPFIEKYGTPENLAKLIEKDKYNFDFNSYLIRQELSKYNIINNSSLNLHDYLNNPHANIKQVVLDVVTTKQQACDIYWTKINDFSKSTFVDKTMIKGKFDTLYDAYNYEKQKNSNIKWKTVVDYYLLEFLKEPIGQEDTDKGNIINRVVNDVSLKKIPDPAESEILKLINEKNNSFKDSLSYINISEKAREYEILDATVAKNNKNIVNCNNTVDSLLTRNQQILARGEQIPAENFRTMRESMKESDRLTQLNSTITYNHPRYTVNPNYGPVSYYTRGNSKP